MSRLCLCTLKALKNGASATTLHATKFCIRLNLLAIVPQKSYACEGAEYQAQGQAGQVGRALKKGAAAIESETSGAAKKAGGSLKMAFGKLKPRVSISGCFHGSKAISQEVCDLRFPFLCYYAQSWKIRPAAL